MLQQSIHAKQNGLFLRFDYPEEIIQQIRRPGECVCGRVVYEGLEATEMHFRNFMNRIDDLDI